MKKNIFGVTLLFTHYHNKKIIAVKSSYIIIANNFMFFNNKIKEIAENICNNYYKNYKFIGIDDIYISDKEGIGNYLGRTSYFDIKTISAAKKKLVLDRNKLKTIITNNINSNKNNLSLVYFHKDEESEKFNSTIIIYTQIDNINKIGDITKLATDKSFIKTIYNYSIEQLYIDKLEYIGVCEFYPIKNIGLFEYTANFSSINDLSNEFLHENEVEEQYKSVLQDYSML